MLTTARYHLERINGQLFEPIDLEVRMGNEWIHHNDIRVGRPRRFRFVDADGTPGITFGTIKGLLAEASIYLPLAR